MGRRIKRAIKKTQFHEDPIINDRMKKRALQIFGIGRYGGDLHAGDLSLRIKASKIFSPLLVEWLSQVPPEASNIYFVTICTNLGQTPRELRHLDVVKLRTQVSNLVANHFKADALIAEWFGMMDIVEVRGRVPGFEGPIFHGHFHGVFASNRCLPKMTDMNAKAKSLQSTTMPGSSIHYWKIKGDEVPDDLQRLAFYIAKPPYKHVRWTAEEGITEDSTIEILSARAEKTGKLSFPSLFMQLEHLRLLDFRALIQASGDTSKVLKKRLLSELKDYHEAKLRAGYTASGCGCSRKEFSIGLRQPCESVECDWEILRLLREHAGKRLQIEDVAEPTVIRSVRESGMREGIEILRRS